MTTPKPPPLDIAADAPPSEAELRAASELRDALANPALSNEDADLVRALALAHSPRSLGETEHRALLAAALARPSASRSGRVIRVTFAVSGLLAAAAALVLVVHPAPDRAPEDVAPLKQSRSTQPLFRESFAREGGESARVDRIAMARAGDLRDNEFRRWGVR